MLNVNNTLIAGGSYSGNQLWNKNASNLDHCFKIYHIEAGEALLFSANKKFSLKEGEYYFINGFEIEKQCCPVSFQINWLHFMYASIFLKQLFRKFPVVTKISSDSMFSFQHVFQLFKSYFHDYSTNKELDSQRLSDYFKIQSLLSMFTSLLLAGSGQNFEYLSGTSSRLFPAIEYINNKYRNSILLKNLADLCFMSENYFHSQFKMVYEITPNNYILQLRMNEALHLLTNSNLSIKEVAIESGYSDAAYFSRTFSKYFSLSPKQYKKMLVVRVP